LLRQPVDDLALSLVAPLGSDNDNVGHAETVLSFMAVRRPADLETHICDSAATVRQRSARPAGLRSLPAKVIRNSGRISLRHGLEIRSIATARPPRRPRTRPGRRCPALCGCGARAMR